MSCQHCSPGRLCDACIARWVETHRGNAQAIGRAWAAHVQSTVGDRTAAPAWPGPTEKTLAIATRKVHHLAAIEPRVVARLAEICEAAAGGAYTAWRCATTSV